MSGTTAKDIVRAELEAHLLELTSLLAAEYDAIRARDTEQLTRLARDKQLLVETIDATSRSADISALLADPDAHAARHLQTLMSRVQQANRVNGAAIDSCQVFTISLLDILRGRVPGERTYTSRGRLGAEAETMTLVRI